jgi:hypothetical protein
MEDRIRERLENGTTGIECGLVTAAHDQELAFLRGAFSAAERNVEERHGGLGREAGRELFHGARRDGRGDRYDRAVAGARDHAILAEDHGLHLLVEADHHDHEIAGRGDRLRRIDRLHAGTGRRLQRSECHVVSDHGKAALGEPPCHRQPHLA